MMRLNKSDVKVKMYVKVKTDVKVETDVKIKVDNNKTKMAEERTIENIDISDASKLSVFINVGNFKAKFIDDTYGKIIASINASANNKQDINLIMDNLCIVSKLENEEFIIKIADKNDGQDMWEWLDSKIDGYNLSVDIDLEIPKNFNEMNILCDTGNITILGAKSKIIAQTDVGSIFLDQIEFVDTSRVLADTGSIQVEK